MLNMHDIALGATTENPHFGDCSNPWNTAHIPGGSSGGSGAALAGGLCMGSLGTDTGGSRPLPAPLCGGGGGARWGGGRWGVRRGPDAGGPTPPPASLCGVVGLKPTYGRVSLRGVIQLSWSLDHAGPLARRVKGAGGCHAREC